MNQQAAKLENYVKQIGQKRKSMFELSEENTTKNELGLVSLVQVLLESIQATYANTLKREDRQSFLALTDELIVLTEDLR
jgi:hypothetical protein